MIVPERLVDRIKAVGLSYTAVAERVGVKQPTITRLARGEQRRTTRLQEIARVLRTTPAYLNGETDDPDEGAPSPPLTPTVQHVMMSVALPSEAALARMFAGMIDSMPGVERHDLARELAVLLPIALGSMQGQLIERPSVPAGAPPAQLEDDGDARPARRRA